MNIKDSTHCTAAQVALVFDCSSQWVGRWSKSGCPRNSDRSFDLIAVVRWKIEQAEKLNQGDADPLMSGGGSEALERYRDEKAKIARLDRLVKEDTLLPRDEVRSCLEQIAAIVRGAGERLAREHGDDARKVLDEALDDADELIGGFGDVKD